MENLSHPLSENTGQKPYLIFSSSDVEKSLFDGFSFNFTEKKFLADIQISKDNELFIVRSKNDEFTKKLNLNLNNLKYFLNLLDRSLDINSKKVGKAISAGSKRKLVNTYKSIELRELSEIFLKSRSISKFCQKLFHHTFFKDYQSIHLFLHKKGSAHSVHIQITKEDIQQSQESISEFSTLFQAVKKSKNRSFGQATLKASNYKIIGTCIAQEFSLLNHNMVFLFSNDDFLPQPEKAIDEFQSLKNSLKVLFEILLNSEYNYERVDIIKNTISTLLEYSGEHEDVLIKLENLSEDNYVNFDAIITQLKERFFDHADINLVERIALLGELLNTLQHELSNPLFGLHLSSEILLGEDLDPEQKMFVKNINLSIKRSQNILANFSGLYQKKVQMEKNNLIDILNEVSTLTKSESRNVKKEINLVGLSKDECIALTNPTWLAQIFFNLIINSTQALKTMGHKSPQIFINISRNGDFFEIIHQDNGPGIPAEKIKFIFDPFFTTKKEGNGLGLAISKKLAKKLGGDLLYETSDVGAKFILRLPV